jgi:hypothetical protein
LRVPFDRGYAPENRQEICFRTKSDTGTALFCANRANALICNFPSNAQRCACL